MLSFQVTNEGREIQIDYDQRGMAILTSALERLPNQSHLHFRTSANGGHELGEKTPWGEDAVAEVIVTFNAAAKGPILSFEVANRGRAIQIYCDEQGLTAFIKALERARANGDHIHLRTPADGGRDLSETNPFGQRSIPEVVLNWIDE